MKGNVGGFGKVTPWFGNGSTEFWSFVTPGGMYLLDGSGQCRCVGGYAEKKGAEHLRARGAQGCLFHCLPKRSEGRCGHKGMASGYRQVLTTLPAGPPSETRENWANRPGREACNEVNVPFYMHPESGGLTGP